MTQRKTSNASGYRKELPPLRLSIDQLGINGIVRESDGGHVGEKVVEEDLASGERQERQEQ
jgi:hypothetical protein